MSLIHIEKHDSWDTWRNKINDLSLNVGDLELLETPSNDDIVSAINSLLGGFDNTVRRSIIISLALN